MLDVVLDVGNCGFDHENLAHFISTHFEAQMIGVVGGEEALQTLQTRKIALVLVNRLLPYDATDGIELIQQIKADSQLSALPVMLLSNYPEAQAKAIALGAEPGFGKGELAQAATLEKIDRFLKRKPAE